LFTIRDWLSRKKQRESTRLRLIERRLPEIAALVVLQHVLFHHLLSAE
jgi:hypothetical protein